MDVLSRYHLPTESNKTLLKQNVIFGVFLCMYTRVVCHGAVLGDTESIIDGSTMTSLGRQLGGEGGWRASGSDRNMIEHEQCCFVRHYDEECWTMSLLAFALGLLRGVEERETVKPSRFYFSGILKLDHWVTIRKSSLFLDLGLF